jgi:hypothetical protein
MATAATSPGIMGLPASEKAPAPDMAMQPQLGLDDSYDAVQQGLQNASPDAHAAVNAELAKLAPQLDQLPDEVLDQLLQIIQYMHDNPKEYSKALQELVNAGIIEEGDFPEEYDPEFLATMGMVIMQAKKSRQGAQGPAAQPAAMPMPPANMARGGIAEAAHLVASRGRGKDTMLAHITPREAKMLRAKGGMGTINPATGLPEYGWFSDAVKSVGNAIGGAVKGVANVVSGAVKGIGTAVKSLVSSPIGKVLGTVALATFLGPGAFGISGLGLGATASMAVASGAMTALGGGSLKDVLKSAAIGGATAFFGAPGGAVSNFVGGAVQNAAANAAITSGIVGTGIGLLSGQKLQDAVKSGLTAGAISGLATGATKGFSAQIEAPKVPGVPTVEEMATEKLPSATDVTTEDGVTTRPVNPQTDLQGRPLPPADASGNYMQPAEATSGQVQMTNPDGSPRIEYFNSRPSTMYQNPDGSITYKPIPINQRVYSDTGIVSIKAPSYSGQPGRFGFDVGSETTGGAPSAMNVASQKFVPSSPVAAPSSDVLGDFIAQNDAARQLASTPAAAPQPTMWDQAKSLYNEYLSPSGIREAGVQQAEAAGQAAYDRLEGKPEAIRTAAYNKAYEAAMPGVISTYGPITAAGLGIAGLAGAFTPKKPQPSPEQQAMSARLQAERERVAANPGAYAPQGLERYGIQYNDRGEIVGSQPWTPQQMGPTEVAGSYMPYTPSPYMSPSGGIGNPYVAQPYNTASMYNFMPRYAADGGIMSNSIPPSPVMRDMGGIASLATGGYPRRTGQISGPGTETSDSIPAMLSDGEFVMTAKAVRGAGKGNRLAGAKKMYALMHQLERNAARG